MKLEKAIIEKLEKDLETVKTMDDLLGKNGVIKKFIKHLTIATVIRRISFETGRADSPSGL
ncbi:MAG: hypothetical protein H0Z29_01520 [Candidatus Marinimicrobia bacterium]|nr:hypothetical protein [Candidatus Neomarinimicrobiota bacterium]